MQSGARASGTWVKSALGQCAAWLATAVVLAGCAGLPPADPLPSWNEGPTKAAIVKFVADTTQPGSPGYVPPAERIATFDNDGTLWTEHPVYVEVLFTLDRTGHVVTAQVSKTVGDAAFDGAALDMMKRSDPVPAPPPLVADEGLTFGIPVAFRAGAQTAR